MYVYHIQQKCEHHLRSSQPCEKLFRSLTGTRGLMSSPESPLTQYGRTDCKQMTST